MAEVIKEQPKAQPSDFQLAEFSRNIYRHYPAVGITREHLMDPSYWAIISRQMTPGSLIEAFAQDGTYYAELLVLSAERTYAKVHCLSWNNLTTSEVAKTQDAAQPFRVEYKGPKMKNCVIRLSDGEVIHQGSQTKEEASAWLQERAQQLTVA